MIELIVNNTILDFESNENLPFTTTIKIDDFFSIGSPVSTFLDNLADSIVVPATATNQLALRTHLTAEWYEFKAIEDGITLFEGKCIIANIIKKGDALDKISLSFKDITSTLFESLSNLYLAQLDLGTQLWTSTEIENSWIGDVSNYKGLFAPIVYGTLSTHQQGDSLTGFVADDFRFSVYAYHIIHEIFKKVGYTLVSNLVETNFFKHIAYLNTGKRPAFDNNLNVVLHNAAFDGLSPNGKRIKFGSQFASTQYWNAIDHELTLIDYTGIYVFESTLVGDYTFLGLEKGTDIIGQFTETNVIEILLEKNDVITFFADNGTTTIAGGVNVTLKKEAYEHSIFEVSDCLPRIKATTFLKALTQLFNGVWKVDEVHKKVYFDSRFENSLGSGWYVNEVRNKNDIKLHDNSNFGLNTNFVNDIVLCYKDGNDGVSRYLKEDNTDSIPLNAAKVEMKQSDTKTVQNSLFEPLFTGISQSCYGLSVPLMLPSDYKKGDDLPKPTFDIHHKLGLKATTTSLRINGTVKQAPVLTQTKGVNGVCLAFNDTSNAKGVVSTFFKKYLYMLKYSNVLTTKALINKHLAVNEDFKKLVEYQGEKYILLELKEYDIDKLNECGVTLIEYANVKKDSVLITSNLFENDVYVK